MHHEKKMLIFNVVIEEISKGKKYSVFLNMLFELKSLHYVSKFYGKKYNRIFFNAFGPSEIIRMNFQES